MFQFLIMELNTQKKIAFFIPIIMFPLFLTLGDRFSESDMFSTIIFSLAVGFISYFLTSYSNSNTGETEKLQYRFLLSMPISRKLLIIAKFTTVLVWWLVSYLWLILILILLKSMTLIHIDQPILNFEVLILSLCCSYFMNSIFYPIYYKFGYRITNIVGTLIFFILTNAIGKIGSLNPDNYLISFLFEYPLVALVSLAILFTLVSYIVTLNIFSKIDY